MNYIEAIDWLEKIPMSFDADYNTYELKLDKITKFLNHLGNPQNNQKFIHVAGTNGKGSTCHIISSILQEHGYDVGLFSSPHLYEFTERIKINSDCVEKKFVAVFIKKNRTFIKKNKISFFETSFAISLCYFKLLNPDFVIVEVGLGGRLDATNVINPIISVITNIGHDHKKFLGNNIKDIAREKAGIIKKGVPLIIGESNANTNKIFESIAKKFNCKFNYANPSLKKYKTDLHGNYQNKNINTAIKTLENVLSTEMNKSCLKRGLSNVKKNTNFSGRWDIINEKPKIILDAAHNLSSVKIVFDELKNYNGKIRIVFGTLDKKDQYKCIELFDKKYEYYLCSPNVKRSMNLKTLCFYADKLNIKYQKFKSVISAYTKALKDSNKDETIIIMGSFFIISDLKNNLL